MATVLEAHDKEQEGKKAQQPTQPATAEPIAQLQYCPSCGKKLQPDWEVCGYCGKRLKKKQGPRRLIKEFRREAVPPEKRREAVPPEKRREAVPPENILWVLWFIALLAMLFPWATTNEKVFSGLDFLVPFGFPYLIGLIWGLVVLITKTKPFVLSLIAETLMITGVFGGFLKVETMKLAGKLVGATVSYSAGIGFALIWSLVYTVVAPVLGKRMVGK